MGTSLSGLTPATTFDGLLKVGDNDPLTATLKPISTGDGTDTMLELSTSALQIGGATGMYWDNTNKRLGIATDAPSVTFEVYGAVRFRNNLNLNGTLSNSSTGEVNINNLGFFDAVSSNVGVGESTPTSRLHIKGSGATSATTSLLVQNSAGTNIFKVVDDNTMFYHTHKFRSAGGYLYIEGEGNADRSLKVGQNFTASSYDGHIFKTYDGVAYSEAMRITGANDQFVGIGEPTPTARLHVKAGTTQDSIAKFEDPRATTDYIEIKNDSTLTDYTGLYWGTRAKIRSKQTGGLFLDCTSGILFADGNTAKSKIDANGNMSVGVATIPASTRLTIKGQGATSATTSLLVQNSAGTEHLKITDDGKLNVSPSVAGNVFATFENTSNTGFGIDLKAGNSTTNYTLQWRNYVGASGGRIYPDGVIIGAQSVPSARLHVKGAGNTDATTSLLVQNSDGIPALSVSDDRHLLIGDSSAQGYDANLTFIRSSGGARGANFRQVNSDLILTNAFGGFKVDGIQTTLKGSGATSATTALLVENSSGTDTLEVRDDGLIRAINGNYSFSSSQATFGKKLAIGVTANQSTAVLEIASTTQGFLPPRMTGTQRDAIESPASGLIIYNTTTNKAQCYNGTSWNDMF